MIRATVIPIFLALACTEPIPPPSVPAPAMDRPSAAIPGDLDVAVRIDVDAVRRFFGPSAASALRLKLADPKEDPAETALIDASVERAHTVWAAFRPGLSSDNVDNVIALRGAFGDLTPHEHDPAFRMATDLGGAFRRYDRPIPRRRSAPARIYSRGDDWLVFVSSAELDSTERAVEGAAGDPHVDPPDQGMVSLAARVPPLVPLLEPRFPAVAEALDGADTLDGSADADDRGLRGEIAVRFESGDAAIEAEKRMNLLLGVLKRANATIATVASGTTAHAVGATLVLHVGLDPRTLSGLVGL